VADGAVRETTEEAGARIALGDVFTMYDVTHVQQVHIFYRAQLLDLEFAAGTESLDVRLFAEKDIPWREIAFRTVSQTLERYFEDRREGNFTLHTGNIAYIPRPKEPHEERLVDS
jgi:ADP-ribose pyrophosphatase YjhB (NUDIX family)